jgi:hypothetical protein
VIKSNLAYNPEGIIITMPLRFFDDYPHGEAGYRRIVEYMNVKEDIVWGQTISGIPKVEVPYCYICFGGFVQYRFQIVNYEKNATKEFNDGGIIRVFENKNWVNLCAPVVKAPKEKFPQRGFQGFRYTPLLF